ncbi:hypothetical protein J2W22_003173 [Sphingomonas kyeonggiensis]|uniref:DUF6678 family protein n=1 Tax=Sphingomonas kyeonggiensis TaxID=1268553 RepID=UPI002789BCED|nr:DUF6678 family protein [Sphingomonas kyeonggiensis]MDQ0251109.1 hypothetical protein [Sphingomonas kyeonggiensis]
MTQWIPAGAEQWEAALTSAANNTKWDELRLAMYGMASPPQFRCRMLSGHYGSPDGEWFYHFRDGGYADIEFVDILPHADTDRPEILSHLKAIGLAGHPTEQGFRVYGYLRPGQAVDRF